VGDENLTNISLRDVFGDFLVEYGKKNANFVVIDVDLSSSTRTVKFDQQFPNRFFNMGIAEQNAMGTAIGFAISAKMPIISGFSIFNTGRAWEFIRMVCHDNLNVKIITTHAGFVGEDGSTHHALEDLSLMGVLPNLNILVPIDGIELTQMLIDAFNTEGPFYIRLPRNVFPQIHNETYKFKRGNIDLLKDGKDICLIGNGYGSILAYQSVNQLESELNISIKVLNLSTIKPLNSSVLVKELKNMKGALVIEEHNSYWGVGSMLAKLASEISPIPMRFLGINDSFGKSGSRQGLLSKYGFTYENLNKLVGELLK
jgi:transketolase